MSRRTSPGPEPGLPLTPERLAPRPPLTLVGQRIDRHTAPGDVVLGLHGRGGWVARAAVARRRRAITLEDGPLARLLAELVLRPPDAHHLDAALVGLAATAVDGLDLPAAVGALFATTCRTCGGEAIADAVTWVDTADASGGAAQPTEVEYRCAACAGVEPAATPRRAPATDADAHRAAAAPPSPGHRLHRRFPVPEGGEALVDDLLALHTPRQLTGLGWILGAIEGDLRAEPIEAALRLALLEAVLPASRLARDAGRPASLRVADGRVRVPRSTVWLERNPWRAFEEGFAAVRAWVSRLGEGDGRARAALVPELAALGDGAALVRAAGAGGLRSFVTEATTAVERDPTLRVRLAVTQPPRRPDPARLALAWHGTAWALGREAAATLPIEPLFGPAFRAPWDWQAAGLRRTLDTVAPLLAPEGRVVLLVEGTGPEPLAAAALGASGAAYRIAGAQVGPPGYRALDLVPPGEPPPPGPRTRANVSLPAVTGAAGDPDLVPGEGLFAPPEPVTARPFSPADAARRVTEAAVAALAGRGEPLGWDALFAEVLVGLDRAGQLRRLAASWPADPEPDPDGDTDRAVHDGAVGDAPVAAVRSAPAAMEAAGDQVARLVGVVRDELGRPTQRRLVEVEPDRWWLRDPSDQAAAAVPLADRLEWATYSLLSTGAAITEARFHERIASVFTGADEPDPVILATAVRSYRSPDAPPGMLITDDDLVRRSHEHTELVAALIGAGHRLGMRVWVSPREQDRRVGGMTLGDRLSDQEQDVYLPLVTRGPAEVLEAVDVIWYVRGKATFLIEVEWTAMIGDLVLRRHARVPQDDRLVRLLVVPPERSDLVRCRLDRSAPLRDAWQGGNWHVLKWNHLGTFLGRDPLELDALEPLLGFDPTVEQTGEQLPLFGARP